MQQPQENEQRTDELGTLRNRSFGGCATCRRRHIKCDEGRPTCSMCQYFGLECGGYEKALFFNLKDVGQERVVRFRRPLLTEAERKRMSDWLVSSVPPKSALRILAQIDKDCDDASSTRDVHVFHGPFGAFRSEQQPPPQPQSQPQLTTASTTSPSVQESESGESNSTATQELFDSNDGCFSSSDPTLSPWTQDLVQAIYNQSDQISVPASPEFWNLLIDPACLGGGLEDSLPMSESQRFGSGGPSLSSQNSLLPSGAQQNWPIIGQNISLATSNSDIVPQDAVPLLKHYATTVITLMTPLQHTKTPWHILFIPHIKHCLAALTLGEQLDHAHLTAFYGALAISAFSLGGVSQCQAWIAKGKAYRQRAREHVRLMLQTAYLVPKVAKYKSILMALLTMVQLSMFAGNRDQTDCYFLEAEKFIRLRGLNRKKSRKIRLLHHCYVFERLFHESTMPNDENVPQRVHVRQAIESSGLAVHSHDSLSFRLPALTQWSNLDEAMSKVKSQELGENDLHLEQPGEFPPTLYPEIFGVPEPWMLLLSLTIRLGKEKENAEDKYNGGRDNDDSTLPLQDFLVRAKAIERRINRLQPIADKSRVYSSSGDLQQSHNAGSDLRVLDNMLEAVQHALAIYFYRRIYDVDSSMLQQRVASVRDCLFRCEHADPTVVHGSAGFIWSAFVAACEADDPEVQVCFSQWFKTCAQRSGLTYFSDTLECIDRIWQEKRSCPDGKGVTWLDLMKKENFKKGFGSIAAQLS
ncbi:hypothetical protein ABEF95_016758 [Exophiala dermatitidis]